MEHDESMNDQVRKEIEALQRTHGYAEEEAEVAWHLGRAQHLLAEMYEEIFAGRSMALPSTSATMFQTAFVEPHFRALFALLDKRVLVRDYPERLGSPADPDVVGDQPD